MLQHTPPAIFFNSPFLFLSAKHHCISQQLFNNLITASFVPYSPNLVGKHKPRLWHPRAGGPQGKCSSIFQSSRTYTVFQNIYSTFSKNSPISNTHRVLSLARTKGNHITAFILILFIFHIQDVSTLVETEYRFQFGCQYYSVEPQFKKCYSNTSRQFNHLQFELRL